VKIRDVKEIPILQVAEALGLHVGRHGMALCFKGHDSHESLSIGKNNRFKCFGCGIKGDALDLVMLVLGANTGEALKWMAHRFGAFADRGQTPLKTHPGANGAELKPLKRPPVTDGAEFAHIYADFMGRLSPGEGVAYLMKRGISKPVAEASGVRVLPKHSQGILDDMVKRHGIDMLHRAGLLFKGVKPFFVLVKNRLVIPYLVGGKVVNLQGRNIDDDREPKYKHLYGVRVVIYGELPTPGKTVHLCEGAIDVLSARTIGIKNAVGVAGVNNFRDEYYDIFSAYRVVICGDADRAGDEFYTRLKKEFLKRGREVCALDYDWLKMDFNITAPVKDLNDVVRLADWGHREKTRKSQVYSELLDDIYTMLPQGGILFNSSVTYSKEELEALEGLDDEMVKGIHEVKKSFKGRLL